MHGGGQIRIKSRNERFEAGDPPQGGDGGQCEYVMLAVSDTGTGMSEEARQHVFEPFFTTKPEGKGTGLRLATSLGIIKQAGGQLPFETEAGRRTTLKIFMPPVAGSKPL